MTERFLMLSLEEEEASESQIAKDLSIPLSTTHYNIKNLVACQLVESKEYTWSQKGKKMEIYKVAKRYIVIGQKTDQGLQQKLQSLLGAFLLTGALGWIIQKVTEQTAERTVPEIAAMKIAQVAPMMEAQEAQSSISVGWWFVMGAWSILLLLTAYTIWREKYGK